MKYLGNRIKEIREEYFKLTQKTFAEKLNSYLKSKNKTLKEHEYFNQPIISYLERSSKITVEKLLIILEFLYTQKNINISWVLLEDNNTQTKLTTKYVIGNNLIEIKNKIKEHEKDIQKELNDAYIIINNSPFIDN